MQCVRKACGDGSSDEVGGDDSDGADCPDGMKEGWSWWLLGRCYRGNISIWIRRFPRQISYIYSYTTIIPSGSIVCFYVAENLVKILGRHCILHSTLSHFRNYFFLCVELELGKDGCRWGYDTVTHIFINPKNTMVCIVLVTEWKK